jgi:hypothetical protein
MNKANSFQKLFSTGIIGWLLGSLAIFVATWTLTKPEAFSDALMSSLSYWWIAFALGFLALLVRGALIKQSLGQAVVAYLLPIAVITGAAGLCLAIYPDAGFRDELVGYLPVVLVFYVFGLVWIRVRNQEDNPFARAVLPPIIGGLMILAFVVVPVFSSNAFLYRNAFGFSVVKTTTPEGVVQAEAVLEIHKPGNYQFTAPQFDIGPDFSPEKAKGEITWGAAGEPKEGKTGTFPLQIRWNKSSSRPPEMPPMPEFMTMVILEVRDAGTPETVISTVSAPLPSEVK